MTATLIGSFSLGDAIPGLRDALTQTGDALQAIKGVVDSSIGSINTLKSAIDGLASSLDATKSDLLLGPLGDLQDAVNAAQSGLTDLLAITDPSAYLAGVIAQVEQALALLESLIASDYLSDLIAGANAAVDAAQGRVDDMAGYLDDMTDIADDVRNQTALLGQLADTLQDASNAAIGGLIAYNNQISEMLNSGVFVVSYTGALGSLGSDVDAVLPSTGIGSSTQVAGPLLIVKTANTSTLAALNAAFGL